jgi:hypothetical protein
MAQLVARLHGMQKVRGSNPLSSTRTSVRVLLTAWSCARSYNGFMRDTSSIGTKAEATVLAALVHRGFWPLLPFGDGRPYDIVVDDGVKFLRVQCKTGRLIRGAVVFPTSTWCRDNKSRSYRGYADYFGVFCPDNGQVYFVPVADVPNRTANLRIAPPRNGQTQGLRWGKDYVIWPPPMSTVEAPEGTRINSAADGCADGAASGWGDATPALRTLAS